MARYNLSTGQGGTPQNMTTTYKTLLGITAATGATTLRRAWIYYLSIGPDSTPADNTMVYKVDSQTTTGTGTVVAPRPLYQNDAAALVPCRANHTVEPTVTDNTELLEIPPNQRTAFQWMCSPGGELIVPAVDANGIGLRAKSAGYASTMVAGMQFYE